MTYRSNDIVSWGIMKILITWNNTRTVGEENEEPRMKLSECIIPLPKAISEDCILTCSSRVGRHSYIFMFFIYVLSEQTVIYQ